jgi:HSP20 family protein
MTRTAKTTKLPEVQTTEERRLVTEPFFEMERLFNRMFGHHFGWPRRWGEWPHLFEEEGLFPRVDMIEQDDAIVVRAEVPGVAKEDLDISMTDNALTISGKVGGEKRKEEGDFVYHEMRRGEFSRTIGLPTYVKGTEVKAQYHDGVVELTLPKVEGVKRRKITIEG